MILRTFLEVSVPGRLPFDRPRGTAPGQSCHGKKTQLDSHHSKPVQPLPRPDTGAAMPTQAGGVAVVLDGLCHRYGSLRVLADVDLGLDAGDHLAVMGPSGAGKSTLLALLGGLDVVQAGSIQVGDQLVERLRGRQLADYRRRRVGFVFQHFGLLEALTARENVELAMALAGLSRPARRRRAGDLLDRVGLAERAAHVPAALSGGERQRVAIARAIANRPALLLADEPTGNLDEDTACQVLDLLSEVRDETGCTMIVVTHNPEVARRADRRVRLSRGRLVL
jgi:putative ABC transport system ATP-binding protein